MKTVTVAAAQAELPKLIAEAEPLVLTEASRPVAILLQIAPPFIGAVADRQLTVVPLRQFLSSGNSSQATGDDSAYVVLTCETKSPAHAERDWWGTLQTIAAEQEKRGFVGTVSEIDHGDEGYDERMKAIEQHTVSRDR